MKKFLLIVVGLIVSLIVLAVAGVAITYVATAPDSPDADAPSAAWLEPGPYAVGEQTYDWVDTSRPTQANNEFPGADSRTFAVQMWYPEGDLNSHPLVIYSHGFMSNRGGGTYMAEALASHGYVVVATNYPLTHGGAPGGPLVTDVANQPADVSFLIDQVLGLENKPFSGSIDEDRIGVTGISLGGLTSTLAGYHPRWRDDRIDAVASIAGPAYMFTPAFFANAAKPFLMIAGTLDAIVEYQGNAHDIPERVPGGILVTVDEGSHLGFVDMAEPLMRMAEHPDGLGCQAILSAVGGDASAPPPDASQNPFQVLGGPEDGVVFGDSPPGLCTINPLPKAAHPGRQHMITKVALLAFFESHFAADPARRAAAGSVLNESLARDFAEAEVAL